MISILSKKNNQNIFYVDNYSINILSINKLSKELNCEVI
jgi:sRNA-binding carbon storage regulator CsrA